MVNKIVVVVKKGLVMEEIESKIRTLIGNREVDFIRYEDLLKEHLGGEDLVITIGGDGTFIKSANLIEDSYILGINSDHKNSEGALTGLTIDELDRLKEVFEGNFGTLLRYRAKVKINGKDLDEFATNEVYIGSESQFHSSRYVIRFGDVEEEHRSSGIVVSTGTGSRAWFSSAGGDPFNHDAEKLSFIVREPYVGKRLFKPTILKGDLHRGEKLVVESKRDFGGIIAINDSIHKFDRGDIVEISLSDKPLKVVKLD